MLSGLMTWVTGNKALAGLIGAMALVIAIGGSYFLGSYNGHRAERITQALVMERALNETLKRNTAALEKASAQRRIDDAKVASTTKGLSDVVKAEPDAAPTRRGVLLTCQRMRNEGRSVAAIPECAGLDPAR